MARAAKVVVEKQQLIHILSVCLWPQVLSMQCAGTILSYVVYPAIQYVSILSKNGKMFEKKVTEPEIFVSIFSTTLRFK